MNKTLAHYGVKGMKWGIITKTQTGSNGTSKSNPKESENNSVKNTPRKEQPKPPSNTQKDHSSQYTNPKRMSNEELRDTIGRMELMKKYNSLYDDINPVTVSKGKKFVEKVLTKAGENITTQVVTYGLGKAVNKIFNEDIVNPKKGQKDK